MKKYLIEQKRPDGKTTMFIEQAEHSGLIMDRLIKDHNSIKHHPQYKAPTEIVIYEIKEIEGWRPVAKEGLIE